MRVADRLFNELNSKIKDHVSGSIIGHQKIGDNTLKLFVSSYRPITKLNLATIISKETNNLVTPYLDSMVVAKDNSKYVASVCCYRVNKKFYTEHNKLRQITANTFLDEDLGEIWTKEVKDGKPIFFRSNDDDINKVCTELSLTASRYHRSSINIPTIEANIYAQVFIFNGQPNMLLGKIIKFNDTSAIVDFDSTKKEIPVTAIVQTFPYAKSKQDVIDHIKLAEPPESANPEYYRRLDETAK